MNFGLAPKLGVAADDLVDDPGAEVPAAAALVIERNVLGGSVSKEVPLGTGSGTPEVGPCSRTPCGITCL